MLRTSDNKLNSNTHQHASAKRLPLSMGGGVAGGDEGLVEVPPKRPMTVPSPLVSGSARLGVLGSTSGGGSVMGGGVRVGLTVGGGTVIGGRMGQVGVSGGGSALGGAGRGGLGGAGGQVGLNKRLEELVHERQMGQAKGDK